LCKVRLVVVILAILVSIVSLSCSTSGDGTNFNTPLFPLIPHKPGDAPMVPHPEIAYTDCALCHIDTSNTGSSIKIFEEHSCNECHNAILTMDYNGPCCETEPVNNTCIFDICHQYP